MSTSTNGIYDLSQPGDRLRLALSAPNKVRRWGLIEVIRRRYGEVAAQDIKKQLHAIARERKLHVEKC